MPSDNSLRYIELDYDSQKDSLLNRIRSRWSTVWNDFLVNNFGIVLVDLISWSTSTLAYIINRTMAENFLPTMSLRESAVRLGALVNYQLKNPGAATILCEAALRAAVLNNVTLRKNTAITSSGDTNAGTIFELEQDYVIQAGKLQPEYTVLKISATDTGTTSLRATLQATNGSNIFVISDSTIDLTDYISNGQYVLPEGTSNYFLITDIKAVNGSINKNAIVADRAWTGSNAYLNVDIVERRINFIQGQTVNESFTSPDYEVKNYLIRLSKPSVIDNSVVVTINGSVWQTVKSFIGASSTDNYVTTSIATDGATVITFGDGTFGALVPINSNIDVTYRVGGGSIGNVKTKDISTTIIGIDTNSVPVQVQVSNQTSEGIGGTDSETLQEAVVNIPRYIRANDRGVTTQDYEALASQFSDPTHGQIRFARASTRENNTVLIYAWSLGANGALINASTALKNNLKNYLVTKAIGTDNIIISDGTSTQFPISLRFKVLQGFSITDVENSIIQYIDSIITGTTPGQPVIYSDLISGISNISGIDNVSVATPIDNVYPESSSEIFIPPTTAHTYTLSLSSAGSNIYESIFPAKPLKPWSVNVTIDGITAIVLPHQIPGRAMIVAPNLSEYLVGTIDERPLATSVDVNTFFADYTNNVIYKSNGTTWISVTDGGSYIDLSTGKFVLATTANPSNLSVELITAQGYDSIRIVNLYITYAGDSSQYKREDIRKILKVWADGFRIGDSLFAESIKNSLGTIVVDTSRSNVHDTVLSVSGVTNVTKVALAFQSNSNNRIDPSATEIIQLGDIYLNGVLN